MDFSVSFDAALTKIFAVVKTDEPLALHTTLGVGGPAKRLVTATTIAQLQEGIRLAHHFDIPAFVLGWGSNLIVSDRGFPGLIIKNRAKNWKVIDEASPVTAAKLIPSNPARLRPVGEDYYRIDDLMYSEENDPAVIVQVESGAKIDPLMKALFRHGITGLQWFAGIPATVGGAVYMNMHGGYHFFGDLVHKALVFNPRSTDKREGKHATSGTGDGIKQVDQTYFQFDYDYSILQETKEAVLWVQLRLYRGDLQPAKATAREWARRKALQPQRSAGCIFRNLSPNEQQRLKLPTPSIGYLVEHVLELKGERRGDAVISPRHAAFIENLGKARAQEIMELIKLIKERAKTELNLDLREEVEYLGEF
jgi:UDP-N-acetylmuramate dehydrogenase